MQPDLEGIEVVCRSCAISFFAERLYSGIRYRERQFDEGVKVLKIIKLNYSAVADCPAVSSLRRLVNMGFMFICFSRFGASGYLAQVRMFVEVGWGFIL